MKDPVCGMTVTDKSFYHLEHQGQTQYFCGTKCKLRFATSGQRHTSAGLSKTALPATNASHHRLTWRTVGLLSLALLSAIYVRHMHLYRWYFPCVSRGELAYRHTRVH